MRKGLGCHRELSPHTPAPASVGTAHQSASDCCNFLLVSAAACTRGGSHQSECECPSCGHLIPPWLEQASVPQSAVAFTPYHLEQMPEGGPHIEVGPKPKLSPRGCTAAQGRGTEISLYSCTSCGLNPHDQLGKPCICGISE